VTSAPVTPDSATGDPEAVTLIEHALVVTMNQTRDVLGDAGVALRGRDIVAVGDSADLARRYVPRSRIDASRMVVVPGMVNAHFHAATEPLTRGVVPDDTSFEENVFACLSPLAASYREGDERLAAQLGAVECLKTGTTCFLEAGTGWHLDAVVDGLLEVGVRARVGRRIWDRPDSPAKFRQTTDEAITNLAADLDRHTDHEGGLVRAWAILVGHVTCTDHLWQAARVLADEHGVGLSFHMSPAPSDPDRFLAETGRRPVEHLDDLGVLGPDVVLTHGVYLDDHEVAILGARGCSVAHCPTTALKVAYGVTQVGKMPEMAASGVNVCIGTDGSNASNYADMYRAAYLVAGLFKDARRDPTVFPATSVLEMSILGGARAVLAESELGSIEVGKRAELVLHDVANQLVYSADGRSVHTVFVDGRRVVEAYRMTTVDEERLFAEAQRAAEAVLDRLGRRPPRRWPTIG